MVVAFPSFPFFQALQNAMQQESARFRRLGFIDTTFGIHITAPNGQHWRYLLTFEVFDCREITEVREFDLSAIDFVISGDLATWTEMLQNIQQRHGADVTHSLNTLTHFGERMTIKYDDPDNRDKFFRFQESIQEFFNLVQSLDLDFSSTDLSTSARV